MTDQNPYSELILPLDTEGWAWDCVHGSYIARGPGEERFVGWEDGALIVSREFAENGWAPGRVALCTILANAPDLFLEAAAELAKPVPADECPRHYIVAGGHGTFVWVAEDSDDPRTVTRDDDGIWIVDEDSALFFDNPTDPLKKAIAHRAAVAADCFPEMAKTIKDLKKMVTQLKNDLQHARRMHVDEAMFRRNLSFSDQNRQSVATDLFGPEEAARLFTPREDSSPKDVR